VFDLNNKYGGVMNLSNLRRWVTNKVSIETRLLNVTAYYLLFLVYITKKKSLVEAKQFSGLDNSQFSRFLKNHSDKAVSNQKKLSKKQAKQFSKTLKQLSNGSLPWKIAILIDSTIQRRSRRHTENAQKFNHGQGYVIGHQWTNILLLINDKVIPLTPIPFQTKKYCRKIKIKYKTEHELVIKYLQGLDLKEFIGSHNPKEVVVLTDTGYDDRDIENAITKKNWKYIIALKKKRSVKSQKQYSTTKKSEDWSQIAEFFKNHRLLKWATIRFYLTTGPKRKRKDFRIRQTIGYLRHVGEVQLVCSEFRKRPDGRRKYLACNDLKATARHILLGYRLRWIIEIFHKDVKQYLGFEDIAATSFDSVTSHVHWVYCAYILLNMDPPGIPEEKLTIREKQLKLKKIIESGNINKWRQMLTQFNGVDNLMDELYQVIQTPHSCNVLC